MSRSHQPTFRDLWWEVWIIPRIGSTAFRSDFEFYSADFSPFWYSESPTIAHITYLFEQTQFQTFVRNSLVIGIAVVAITIVAAVPAAYSLARLARRWGERLGAVKG